MDAEPAWAKQLEGEMSRGKHVITFRARSPVSSQSATCQMIVHVRDTVPPRVRHCPKSFAEFLPLGHSSKRVKWREPVFHDNVAIAHVMASFLPGHYFSEGRHHVLYQATDADGNKARCGFTITVRSRSNPKNNYYSPPPPTRMYPSPSTPQLPSPLGSAGTNTAHNNKKNHAHHHRNHGNVHAQGHGHRGHQKYSIPAKCNNVPNLENGRMDCHDSALGKKCTPVCEAGHSFYQKFTSRAPTYLCNNYRVDWEIRRFIPDCSPVKEVDTECEEGWEQRDGTCVACPPGMFRSGADKLCQLCLKGFYAEGFGSTSCDRCPTHHTTRGMGSRRSAHCYYSRHAPSGNSLMGRKTTPSSSAGSRGQGRGRSKLGFRFYSRWMTSKAKKNGGHGRQENAVTSPNDVYSYNSQRRRRRHRQGKK